MDAQLIANNPQEEVLIKIRSLQNKNATSAQCQEIRALEYSMKKHFFELIYRMYGIDRKQLLEFSDNQIEALAECLYHRVKTRAIVGGILAWTFGLGIPLIGWIMILGTFLQEEDFAYSYHYRRRCNQLRNILGEKCPSAKQLRGIYP